MSGFFWPYALVGLWILVVYLTVSLIAGFILGKIIGKTWIAIPIVILMAGLFYFLELGSIFTALVFLVIIALSTYVIKKLKNKTI